VLMCVFLFSYKNKIGNGPVVNFDVVVEIVP
jgi:hypothetical protein